MSGIRTNAAAGRFGGKLNTLRAGSALGLSEAPPSPGWPPPVRPDGAGVAAARAARDAQHLVRDRARPAARRGPELPEQAARRLRPLRRGSWPTGSWRRASPSAPLSARSRRCCCRRWSRPTSATPARRNVSWRSAGLRAGCTPPARGAPATRPQGVLLFDSSPRLDLESLHVQALELGLRRAGFRTLLLAFDLPPERVVRAIRALDPVAFVFCGGEATLEVVGRLVYTVRQVGSAAPGVRVPGGDACHRRPRDPLARVPCRSRPPSG